MPLTTRTRPAIAIMIAAGTVHVIRSAPLDATVFYAAALVVSVETRWLRTHLDRRTQRPLAIPATASTEVLVVCLVAVGFGALTGPLRIGSRPLALVMAALGLLAAALALSRRPPNPPDPPVPVKVWPWVTVAVAICLWELTTFLQQPDPQTGSFEHPTLSVLVDPQLRSPLVRGCVLAIWLGCGYFLFRKAGLTRRSR